MSNVKKVKKLMTEVGDLIEIQNIKSSKIKGYYVYMVYNGESIPQIGHGSGDRLSKCVRGTTAKKHNKAFICALTEVISENLNQYVYVALNSKNEAIKVEKNIHESLGIRTNRDGATIIEGINSTDIVGIHKELWEKVKKKPNYNNLTLKEKNMAEELFEIVTYATTRVKRNSGETTPSWQGDNLEGNILMNVNKAYLINIYQKLTNNYHKYGIHKLSEEDFKQILEKYSYVPHGKPFEIFSSH